MQGSQQCLLINQRESIRFDCNCQGRVLLELTKCRAGIVAASSNHSEVDSVELGGKFQFMLLRGRDFRLNESRRRQPNSTIRMRSAVRKGLRMRCVNAICHPINSFR